MKILIAGDYAPLERVEQSFAQRDFSCFKDVKNRIEAADYALVNLEIPIVEQMCAPIPKYGPALRSSSMAVDALKFAGFACVTLANNHFRDFGDVGCNTTIAYLQKGNIDYVGGGGNLCEAQKVLYKTISGKVLAVVSVCENEFSIATSKSAGAAPLDLVDNYKQIQEARANADYVLVVVHGGHEFYQLPSPRMKKLYRFFVEIGADAVVNHHQHCYSGYEIYQSKPIVYGLGNFCFDNKRHRGSSWNDGYCVEIDFAMLAPSLKILPYRQCDEEPIVRWMNGVQQQTFEDSIRRLNTIIQDDEALNKAFDHWVEGQVKSKLLLFSSYHNRYLNAAAYRGWLPSLNSKQETLGLINNLVCESHRDVVVEVLKRML